MPPADSGRAVTHWTPEELADEVIKRRIVESISATTVRTLLHEADLKPHRSRYWLNSKDKKEDPEAFAQQVQVVCDCYLEASDLYFEYHTHVVSVDEMTGIQALERIAPTKPMVPGYVESREFEYMRHGTLTLIGNFHVATGRVISPTLGACRGGDRSRRDRASLERRRFAGQSEHDFCTGSGRHAPRYAY
ncbi:MAG: hypothetical protein H8E44_25610 [Planctomycetes bacterium]|nr:hypothetical protein [Planctomycetota bacterium]MBL7038336.1 hypothetical protein [Pirellulaceae bacterium]